MLDTPSLFENLENDQTMRRVASRRALALAQTRVDQRLGAFFRGAQDEAEFDARLALVQDDFAHYVESAATEVGYKSPEHIAASLLDHYRLAAGIEFKPTPEEEEEDKEKTATQKEALGAPANPTAGLFGAPGVMGTPPKPQAPPGGVGGGLGQGGATVQQPGNTPPQTGVSSGQPGIPPAIVNPANKPQGPAVAPQGPHPVGTGLQQTPGAPPTGTGAAPVPPILHDPNNPETVNVPHPADAGVGQAVGQGTPGGMGSGNLMPAMPQAPGGIPGPLPPGVTPEELLNVVGSTEGKQGSPLVRAADANNSVPRCPKCTSATTTVEQVGDNTGDGSINKEGRCHSCNHTWKFANRQNPADQDDDSSRLVSCPECGGDGQTANNSQCPKCHGKGRVPNFGDSMVDALGTKDAKTAHVWRLADSGNTDLGGPSPKIDKAHQTVDNPPKDVEKPDERKDITEAIKAENREYDGKPNHELTEIGDIEHQTLPTATESYDAGFASGGEDSGPHTDTFDNDGQVDPVTRETQSHFKLAMGMSAQDFRMLADAIRTAPEGADKHTLANHVATYLSQTNPMFDGDRFLAAAIGEHQTGRDEYKGYGQQRYPVEPGAQQVDPATSQQVDALSNQFGVT